MSKLAKALTKAKQEISQLQFDPSLRSECSEQIYSRPSGPACTCKQYPCISTLEKNRILLGLNEQSAYDAYNLLRTQVLQQTTGTKSNTLMITSPEPGDGKTLTTINLGISLARDSVHSALVVDTNLRSPKIHNYLDLNCSKGLTDYLQNGTSLTDIFVTPDVSRFVVLPAGQRVDSSTDLLGSLQMRNLVVELKQRYPDRYIIFDCPHLLDMPDSLLFSSYVDKIIVVVRAGKTFRDNLLKSLQVINKQKLIGVVINQIKQ
jgi:exopolysaccharide/PEP-CTERM locus tyrosine autokinase